MSYQPSLSDLDDIEMKDYSNKNTSNEKAYVPSLSDLDDADNVETIFGTMPKPKGLKQDLNNLGFVIPQNKAEREQYRKNQNEALLGAAQSVANYPIKIANLVKDEPYKEFSFAPETEAAKRGAIAGDIGSYFLPGGTVTGSIKGLSAIPKIGKITKAIEDNYLLSRGLGLGKASGEGALYGAAYASPEDRAKAALTGGAFGAGGKLASDMLSSVNPLVNMIGRGGVGYLTGNMLGHPTYGILAGTLFPQGARLMGLQKNPGDELLEGLHPSDVDRALRANEDLGTIVTPAQASGNYVTAAKEGALKRSPEAAQTAIRLEQMQRAKEQNAIKTMLDNIYKSTPESENKIKELYDLAYRSNPLNPKFVEEIRQNPILDSAFKMVKSDPAYTKIPQNNYKFLAEVDRQLFRDQEAAKANRPNSAYAIGQVKQTFNAMLKDLNPAYNAAVTTAAPKMTRQSIEDKFNRHQEDFTAKNFYNKFLTKRSNYKDILHQVRNHPETKEAIINMRKGWQHLSNMKSVSQGEAQAKSALDQARNGIMGIWEQLNKMMGSKSDIKALKAAYSKDWDKGFERIMQNKDIQQRNRDLLNMISKMALSVGLNPDI